MTTMPGRHRSTDPAAPLRVTSMDGGLQVDADAVPPGLVRIAVIDQDTREYDLILRREGRQEIVGRIPPAGADRGKELLFQLESGRYQLRAETSDASELCAEFAVQPS